MLLFRSVCISITVLFSGLVAGQNNNSIKKDYTNEFLIPYYLRSAGYDSTSLKDVTNQFLSEDFSICLNKENQFINGIFSETYARMRVHYDTIYKINSSTYLVKGNLKIRDTVSIIDGQIKIRSIFLDPFIQGDIEIPHPTYRTSVISTCNFSLSLGQIQTAQLNGILQTIVNLDTITNEFSYYLGNNSDYYMNNTFVGVWQNAHNKEIEKCIWGIGLLPFEFTEDFRLSETYVTEKYLKNGWEAYGKLDSIGHYIENNNKWWK